MVFDRRAPRAAQLRQLVRELRAGRARMLATLVSDHRQTAARLRGAYDDIVENLDSDIRRLTGGSDVTPAGIRQFRNATERRLHELDSVIDAEATRLQGNGVEAGYRTGLRNLQNGGLSARFSQTTLTAIQRAIGYADSRAFATAVSGLAPFHAERVGNIIIAAVEQGNNPRNVARTVRRYFTQSRSPMADALRLTRTTQAYAARDATHESYSTAGIDSWIWSSALDGRTCMMCISQHGQRYPMSEKLNEHHNGRCSAIPVTPTWERIGFSGGQEPAYETGADWFARQDEQTQRRIVGPTLLDAINNNRVQFTPDVITGTYTNPIYGEMKRPRNISDIVNN